MAIPDRIVPLDQLDDFKVADHDPDIRGWDVMGLDGSKVGEVDDLLVDTGAMKVRYLDVDVDDSLHADDDRHILVPIGYARLDEDEKQVRVDRLRGSELATLPAYSHQAFTREFETDVRSRFLGTGAATGAVAGDDFYTGESYDDSRLFGSRRNQPEGEAQLTLSEERLAVGKTEHRAGEVEIDKSVETHRVRENVPLRHEEVIIERHAAPAGGAGRTRIEEEQIRIPVNEEEAVVSKRTVPKEEIVVRKREVIENETVEADLRRERAEIQKEGDVDIRDDRR